MILPKFLFPLSLPFLPPPPFFFFPCASIKLMHRHTVRTRQNIFIMIAESRALLTCVRGTRAFHKPMP